MATSLLPSDEHEKEMKKRRSEEDRMIKHGKNALTGNRTVHKLMFTARLGSFEG